MNHYSNIQTNLIVNTLGVAKTFAKDQTISPAAASWIRVPWLVFGASDLRTRIGSFNTPWHSPVHPKLLMHTLVKTDDCLSDLLDQRALEIYNHAHKSDKRIVIMWSGGIDSTVVVSSFIKNLTVDQRKVILIAMDTHSLLENLSFYSQHISGKLETCTLSDVKLGNEFFKHNILLNGDPADAIFGPSVAVYKSLIPSGQHLKPFTEQMDTLKNLFRNPKSPQFADWYVDSISENILAYAPKDINSVVGWFWWTYLNFKWDSSVFRPFVYMRDNFKEKIDPQYVDEYIDNLFYNSEKMQNWSYTNLSSLVPTNLVDHKREAKEYIFELTHDASYMRKPKIPSVSVLNNMSKHTHDVMYFDQDLVGHYNNDPGVVEAFGQLLHEYR